MLTKYDITDDNNLYRWEQNSYLFQSAIAITNIITLLFMIPEICFINSLDAQKRPNFLMWFFALIYLQYIRERR